MADGGGWEGQVPSFCWKPPTQLAWVSTGYLTHGLQGASPCQEVPLTTPVGPASIFQKGEIEAWPHPPHLVTVAPLPWRP